MPAFTFTADSGTDQLTITAHGFLTGAGPAAVRNIGGALPAATPALGPLLDRWIIRIDANTIKLAESLALALAGTPINITSNGTGTNILEIGVPYRRPRTYAVGVQVPSADLNANFDSWIAVHGLLTGQAQSAWSGVTIDGRIISTGANASLDLFETTASAQRIRLQAPSSLSADQTWTLPSTLPSSGRAVLRIDSTGAVSTDQAAEINVGAANAQLTSIGLASTATFDGSAWFLSTSGGGQGPVFDIPLPTGATITAWKVYANKTSASGTISATFAVRNMTTGTTVASGNATNNASNPGNITLTGSSGSLPFVIPAAHSLTVEVSGGGTTGDSVRGVGVTF